jgi:hypothetical protein
MKTQPKFHPCPFPGCDRVLVGATSLKHHLVSHTKLKNYGCDHCDRLFSSSCSLKRHKCSPLQMWKCLESSCEREFDNEHRFHIHMVRHLDENEFEAMVGLLTMVKRPNDFPRQLKSMRCKKNEQITDSK